MLWYCFVHGVCHDIFSCDRSCDDRRWLSLDLRCLDCWAESIVIVKTLVLLFLLLE